MCCLRLTSLSFHLDISFIWSWLGPVLLLIVLPLWAERSIFIDKAKPKTSACHITNTGTTPLRKYFKEIRRADAESLFQAQRSIACYNRCVGFHFNVNIQILNKLDL